jgi:BolA protein
MDVDKIEELLRNTFNIIKIEVENDSGRHKRHKEAEGKGGHFKLLIVSDDFENVDLITRHRKIYEVINLRDQKSIHALAISALTKKEWEVKCQSK